MPVNVDATPVVAVSVTNVSPGAGWVLKLDDAPYDPYHPREIVTTPAGGEAPGRFLVDLREISGAAWQGHKQIDLRLFVTGPPGGASVTFSQIALLRGVKGSDSNGSLARASPAGVSSAAPQIASGAWTACYVAAQRRILLSRTDAPNMSGSTGAISIFLPGITNSNSPIVVEAEKGHNNTAKRPAFTTLALRTTTDTADYEAKVTAYPPRDVGNVVNKGGKVTLFRWRVTAHLRTPLPAATLQLFMPPTGGECRYEPTTASGSSFSDLPLRVLSVHRFGQVGQETGQAFLPCDPVLGCTALYVQNLTALAPFFDTTHTTGTKSVSAGPEGFGFGIVPVAVPVAAQGAAENSQLPAGTSLTLADSFLALADSGSDYDLAAASTLPQARDYLDLLATIYDALPDRPATLETDWSALAEKSLVDLQSPACWSSPASGYLRSYVNEPWGTTTGELTVQLAPLVASRLYERARNLPPTLLNRRITPTLHDFYSPETHSVHDFTTVPHPDRADSETQVGSLMLLAQAAELGSPQAKSLLRDSLDATIALARRHQYRFPVFFDPKTLNALGGVEPDCAGVYAYLMLASYRLFGDGPYLDEARKALATIDAFGLGYAYELHGTALGAVACAQMWNITGERAYLDKSRLPLANVLRHCWLYEPNYGFRKGEHHFFTISAMPGVYAAPAEQYQTWLALREYDELVHDALPPSAQLLVSEFLKYGQTNLRYLYPAYLTPGSLAPASDRGGKLEPNLLVPIEDLNDAWLLSGRIGQEVYGAGGPLALAAKTVTLVPEAGITVTSEYPVHEQVWNAKRRILRLHLSGVAPFTGADGTKVFSGRYATRVTVRYDTAKVGWKRPRIQIVAGDGKVTERRDTLGYLSFQVEGETTLLIEAESTP